MKTQIACDACGKLMAPAEALWDVGTERDLCPEHYRAEQLAQLQQQRDQLAAWLEATHLKRLRELDAEISALQAGSD